MKTSIKTKNETCQHSMKLFGDFWNLKVISVLRNGEMRFSELQNLTSMNAVTLTKKLKVLEEARVVVRHEAEQDKSSVSYALTELGQEALPVLAALNRFSRKARSAFASEL